MNRTLAVAAASLFAAACTGPQVDFCGKTCLGAGSTACGPGYYCNATTLTCQTNGNTCPAVGSSSGASSSGSSSGNSSSGSSGASGAPAVGTACTPPTGAATDPCLADGAGLACNPNPNAATPPDVCTKPVEYETCLANVGCDPETPPLVCTEVSEVGLECLNDCTVTSDCPNAGDFCVTGVAAVPVCYTNPCGPGALADGGSAGDLFAACDAAGINDGTCLPFVDDGEIYGYCNQDGPLAAGATGCGFDRLTDGGTADLCNDVTTCVESNMTLNTYCAPICASGVAGPACSSPAECEGFGGQLDYGSCDVPCTTSATCPTSFTCQDDFCLP
jgi:hypothetical protein